MSCTCQAGEGITRLTPSSSFVQTGGGTSRAEPLADSELAEAWEETGVGAAGATFVVGGDGGDDGVGGFGGAAGSGEDGVGEPVGGRPFSRSVASRLMYLLGTERSLPSSVVMTTTLPFTW